MKEVYYYYLIMIATFLAAFSFIPILFKIQQLQISNNIPYVSLIGFLISYILLLFIVIMKKYYIHTFIYLVGIICIIMIIFLKRLYDTNNINQITENIHKKTYNVKNIDSKITNINQLKNMLS